MLRTVLVVEDDSHLCDFLTFFLQTEGFRVTRAGDGVEALKRVQEFGADVIVMDLWLPRVDGCSAIRQLRADPRTSGIPVIAMTGHWPEDVACEWAERASCDAFFTKPLTLDRLAETIEALATGRKLLAE